MFLLQPVLDFVHFLRMTFFYIWSISLHLGRATFLLLSNIFQILKNIYNGILILGEELLLFLTELNKSIDAAASSISTSANNGIDGVINAVAAFTGGLNNFFTSSELHTRLLASRLGFGIKNFGALLYGSLILIADTLWWLVTLLPRTIISLVVAIIDLCIFTFFATGKAIIYVIQTLINDIFRLSISIFVLFLIWKKRRLLRYLLWRTYNKATTLLQTRMHIILTRWRNYNRPRFVNLTAMPMRLSTIRQSGQSDDSNNTHKHSFQPSCVICRENPKNVLLWPCRHMCLCEDCADRITENDTRQTNCPLCRSEVEFVVPIYT